MNSSFMKAVRPMVHLIVGAFSCFAAILVPQPFMPTLLLGSLCAGENECSEIIYLVGALQLVRLLLFFSISLPPREA